MKRGREERSRGKERREMIRKGGGGRRNEGRKSRKKEAYLFHAVNIQKNTVF